jgi:LuxR family transcriptional regulator, maltose regulon positive regulatory protein
VFETVTAPDVRERPKTNRKLTLVAARGGTPARTFAAAPVVPQYWPDVLPPAPEPGEPPVLQPDLISRQALLNWFSAHRTEPVVTVFAPAGYGKTTAIGQAVEADERRVAWVSLGAADKDPAELMSRVGQVEAGAVLVLDDVHRLHDPASLERVAALCASVPEGSQLVLAGRAEPDIGLARMRAERRLAELRPNDLAFDAAEAGELLHTAGAELTESEVAELTRLTEGWAVGLYLAGLSLGAQSFGEPDATCLSVSRSEAIAGYLRSEVLPALAPEQLEFLTRTAVLEWMSGPLCDAVLEQAGSGPMLESLSRSNGFVIALEDGAERSRCHPLLRAVLVRELRRREPAAEAILNRRAADWCESNGEPESAIEYAFAGDDFEHAARLATACALDVYERGELATVQGWIDRLDEAGMLEQDPAIAVLGAWMHGFSGQPAEAERLASASEGETNGVPLPDGSATIEPWLATLRAGLCRRGHEQMREDAQQALELAPEWSFWQPSASLSLAVSLLLAGEDERADEVFADTVELAREQGINDVHSMALAERALLAGARGDVRDAAQHAQAAWCVVRDCGLDTYMTSALTYVALGRVALEQRDLRRAREHFGHADDLRPSLRWFMPYLGLQVRFELVGERLVAADPTGAKLLLREIDQLLRRVPRLGVLVQRAADLHTRVDALRTLSGDVGPLLTDAELRVLPLLATHLSIGEIAERQFVSRATVKTQAISIYRKLGVTSRSEAVEHAAAMGLIELAFMPPRREFRLAG